MAEITPFVLEERMKNPGGFKAALLAYLAANNCKVEQAKSIAELSLYDQQVVAGLTRVVFFQGQVSAQRTNLQNSFTRPDSEHMIITGIRLLDGTNAAIDATDWSTGLSLAALKNATFTVVVNGVTYLRNFPAADASDELTDKNRGIIYLTEPIVWPAQTTAQVEFIFPVAPGANINLRCELVGVGTLA